MKTAIATALVLFTTAAWAAPIGDLEVKDFFDQLEQHAKELAEGGMELNRIRCLDDGTACRGHHGAGNEVVATGPAKDGRMESITVTQEIPGESEDFWLTSALVMDILDGDFKTVPERSNMILQGMRSAPGASFTANTGRYTFGRSTDNLPQLVVTAK